MALVYQRVQELADITVKRQNKGAVYEICLHPDVTDSQGRLVTADTLLYNYYLRCQTGYTGDDRVCEVPVKGLDVYRYGASGKMLRKRKKKTAQVLKKPDKTLRRQIAGALVTPILRREYQWVRSLYYDMAARKLCQKYPDPVQLFAYHVCSLHSVYRQGKGRRKGSGRDRRPVRGRARPVIGNDRKQLSGKAAGTGCEKAVEADGSRCRSDRRDIKGG